MEVITLLQAKEKILSELAKAGTDGTWKCIDTLCDETGIIWSIFYMAVIRLEDDGLIEMGESGLMRLGPAQ